MGSAFCTAPEHGSLQFATSLADWFCTISSYFRTIKNINQLTQQYKRTKNGNKKNTRNTWWALDIFIVIHTHKYSLLCPIFSMFWPGILLMDLFVYTNKSCTANNRKCQDQSHFLFVDLAHGELKIKKEQKVWESCRRYFYFQYCNFILYFALIINQSLCVAQKKIFNLCQQYVLFHYWQSLKCYYSIKCKIKTHTQLQRIGN